MDKKDVHPPRPRRPPTVWTCGCWLSTPKDTIVQFNKLIRRAKADAELTNLPLCAETAKTKETADGVMDLRLLALYPTALRKTCSTFLQKTL